MAQRITVLKTSVPDSPGSLAKLLTAAANSGLDFLCMCAAGGRGGQGEIYVSPRDVAKTRSLASSQGVALEEYAGFLIEGEDKPGAGAQALRPLGQAGVNIVTCAALAKDRKFQLLVVVKAADGDKAAEALGA